MRNCSHCVSTHRRTMCLEAESVVKNLHFTGRAQDTVNQELVGNPSLRPRTEELGQKRIGFRT